MAPDPVSNERRIDEHGREITQIHTRLNSHADRINRVESAIIGDTAIGQKGLVATMAEVSHAVNELVEWRDELVVWVKAVKVFGIAMLVLVSLIAGGVWWPQIEVLLKLVGGLP